MDGNVSPAAGGGRRVALAAALLALTAAALYARTLGFGFVSLADGTYVYGNPALKLGLGPAGWRWAWTTLTDAVWVPTTWLSFLANHQLHGLAPAGYHATNVALHVLNVALLFLLLARLTGATGRSAFVAAALALHPLNVEAVAWVTARKDVLCLFFMLAGLWLYVGHARRPTPARLLPSLLACALALAAKPVAVVFPLLLLLLDAWPLRRRAWWEKVPFAVLAAAVAAVTYHAARGGIYGRPDPAPLGQRLGQAAVFLTEYARKWLAPTDLAVFYPPESLRYPGWRVALAVVLLAGGAWLAARAARRLPAVALGLAWFGAALVPVLGIAQGGHQLMSDRFAYLAGIGLAIALAWGGVALASRSRLAARAAPVAAVLWLAFLGTGAWRQVGVWRDDLALYGHALAVTRDNYQAEEALGLALAERGRAPEGLPHLERALRLKPYPETHFNLGNLYAAVGRADEAASQFRAAIRGNPGLAAAYNNLASLQVAVGRLDEALPNLRQVAALTPGDARAHHNLGVVLQALGRAAEARACYERALRLDPAAADTRRRLESLDVDAAPPAGPRKGEP